MMYFEESETRFGGKRNPSMDLAAKLIASSESDIITDTIQKQLDKLRMADIYIDEYEVTKVFENGTKIIAFNPDGLVDEKEDWYPYLDERTFRVYLGNGYSQEERERVFGMNFRICAKRPYGLYELIRKIPRYYEQGIIASTPHQVLFIREDGTILLDETDNVPKSKHTRDWYYDTMKRIRQPIIEHVIKSGPELEMVGPKCNKVYSEDDYSFTDKAHFTCITCLNSRNGKYQLMRMGDGESLAFVVFNLETGECLASENGVTAIYNGEILGLPVQDGILCLNMTKSTLYKLELNTKGIEYIRKDDISISEYKELESKKQAIIDAIKERMERQA